MLNRLASRLSPPLSRGTSPDFPLFPIRPYRSILQTGKHYSKSQVVSPAPVAKRSKGVTGVGLFSSATFQTRQSANFSSEMGFENLPVAASRHRVKCYATSISRNDDSSEYSDCEERL